MEFLIDKTKEFEVKIYAVDADGSMKMSLDASELKEDDAVVPEELVFKFSYPCYIDSVELTRLAFTSDGDEYNLDIAMFSYERLNRLLKSWNIVDAEGNAVPSDRDHVDLLNPILSELLLTALDEALS